MQEPIIQDEPLGQEPQGEPDYQTLFEEQKIEFEKLQKEANDLKSITTGRMRQQERDAKLEGIADKLGTVEQLLNLTMQAQTSGNPYELEQEVARIQQESQVKAQTSEWNNFYEDAKAELQEIATSKDLDLYTSPELNSVRETWTSAFNSGDRVGIMQALRAAEKIQGKPASETTEEEAEPAPRARSTERLRSSSGGMSLNDQDYVTWADEQQQVRDLTADEETRLRAALNAINGRRTRR